MVSCCCYSVAICASLAPPRRFVLLSCFMLLLLLRVVASRRAASLEPQLSKILWANLFATAVDFYGLAQLFSEQPSPRF